MDAYRVFMTLLPRVVPQYKEAAKQRILTAAQSAFSDRGYRQTTMEDIAAQLGVSKGALYLYFPSKEELFREMCRWGQNEFQETLRSSFEHGDLLANAVGFFDKMSERPVWTPRLAAEVVPETWRDAVLRRIVRESYEGTVRIVQAFLTQQQRAGRLRKELHSQTLARGLVALYDGLMVALATGLDKPEARHAWAESIGTMLFGALRLPKKAT
jgi:AcrR family transcriptional regulator